VIGAPTAQADGALRRYPARRDVQRHPRHRQQPPTVFAVLNGSFDGPETKALACKANRVGGGAL